MNQPTGGWPFDLIARHTLDRIGTPVGAHIGEDLCRIGQQVAKEHRNGVEAVVLRSHKSRHAHAITVEGTVRDGFEKVTVRRAIGPVALSLETGENRIMTARLLLIAHLIEFAIAHHQVAGDERHFDRVFPLLVELFARALAFTLVRVVPFRAIGFHPFHGLRILGLVIDAITHTAGELGQVDCLDAHTEKGFKEVLVNDRARDAHGATAHGKVGFAAHHRHCQTSLNETEHFFFHVVGDLRVARILHVPSVDTESRETFLRVTS